MILLPLSMGSQPVEGNPFFISHYWTIRPPIYTSQWNLWKEMIWHDILLVEWWFCWGLCSPKPQRISLVPGYFAFPAAIAEYSHQMLILLTFQVRRLLPCPRPRCSGSWSKHPQQVHDPDRDGYSNAINMESDGVVESLDWFTGKLKPETPIFYGKNHGFP